MNNKIILSQNISIDSDNYIRNSITLNNSSYLQNLNGFWFWFGIQTTNSNLYSASGYTIGYLYNDGNNSKSVGNGTLIQIGYSPHEYLTGWGFSGSFSISDNQINITVGYIQDKNYISYLDLTKDFNFWEMVFFY